MMIDFVIVSAPKPPGSRQLISPPAAVLEMAPAKVLHGAVRLHGLASSPTPETQVRVACAFAGMENSDRQMAPVTAAKTEILITLSLRLLRRLQNQVYIDNCDIDVMAVTPRMPFRPHELPSRGVAPRASLPSN